MSFSASATPSVAANSAQTNAELLKPRESVMIPVGMDQYRRLLRYAQRQRSRFILIGALTIAASTLVALQPWPMKLLVDHVLGDKQVPAFLENLCHAFGTAATPPILLGGIVLGGLLLFIASGLLDAALTWAWTITG